MRLLVAGATGALGHALIPKLVQAGHEVVGLSRRHEASAVIRALGGTHATADLLRPDQLHSVVRDARPDVVIHAAKAIPKRGPLFFRDMAMTTRLHHEGTRNLLRAAVDAGSSRIIVESIVFAYGYGDLGVDPLTEDHPPAATLPRRKLAEGVDGVLAMERQVLEAQRRGALVATVLRCGLFYGPNAGTEVMVAMLRRRMMPLPGAGSAVWPVVYIDDVADAFVLASAPDAPSGVFNIVDDHPVELRDFVGELAALAQVPSPWRVPKMLAKVFAPYFAEVATTSMCVSNERAKSDLRWQPAHPRYRDGLRAWTEASKRAASTEVRRSRSHEAER